LSAYDLDAKVALVTGAAINIGRAIALTLAGAGSAVACCDLDGTGAERTAREIADAGGAALGMHGDIRDPRSIDAVLDAAERRFGRVDVLVNNAAITINKTLLEITLDEWRRVLDTTLTGTFVCSKAFARRLVARGAPGVIVNLGSTTGHRGRAGAIAYAAAKGGVLNLTRAMAIELAPYGIRVCSVSPTRSGAPTGSGEPTVDANRPRAHGTANGIPLGRLGTPQDQANAVLFMVSDAASFVTGADLLVDGGALATWSRG
jgi:NAD(P)-dependent dehydrogenase (short-subunit alcohol dehydrogenase family)